MLADRRRSSCRSLNLVVANVGRGVARNVELEFAGDLEPLQKKIQVRLDSRRLDAE